MPERRLRVEAPRGTLLRQILAACPESLMEDVPFPWDQTPRNLDPASHIDTPSTCPTLAELECWPTLAPELGDDIGGEVQIQALKKRNDEPARRVLARLLLQPEVLARNLSLPENRDWWLDLNALMRCRPRAARKFLQELARSRNPQLVQLGIAGLWRLNPDDELLWRQVLDWTETVCEGDVYWWSYAALREDTDSGRRAMVRSRWIESEEEAREVLRERPLGKNPSQRQRSAVEMLLRAQFLDDETMDLLAPQMAQLNWLGSESLAKILNTASPNWGGEGLPKESPHVEVAVKRIRENPARFCPLVFGLGEKHLRELEPRLREVWRQCPEDPELFEALSRCPLTPGQRLADLLTYCSHESVVPSDFWILHWEFPEKLAPELWKFLDSQPRSQVVERMQRLAPLRPRAQAVERLAAGHLDLALFRALLTDTSLDAAHQKLLGEVSQRQDALGGVASAMLERKDWAESASASFLTYYIATSLYRRHTGLSPQVLFRLQEGAPSELFQAAQAYLEADPQVLARDLASRRGRVVNVPGRGMRVERAWEQPYLAEFLRPQAPDRLMVLRGWFGGDLVVRVGSSGGSFTITAGEDQVERTRSLSATELAALANLPLSPPNPLGGLNGYPAPQAFLDLRRDGLHRRSLEWEGSEIDRRFFELERKAGTQPTLPTRIPGARVIPIGSSFVKKRVWARGEDVRIGFADYNSELWKWSRPSGDRVPAPPLESRPAPILASSNGRYTLVNEPTFPLHAGGHLAKFRLEEKGRGVIYRRGDDWRGLAFLRERNAFLLVREFGSNSGEREFAFLHIGQEARFRPCTGDFEPWLEHCQSQGDRWWVAAPEPGGTHLALYSPKTSQRTAVAFYPGIQFTTSSMWVDGSQVYVAIGTDLVCLPLP